MLFPLLSEPSSKFMDQLRYENWEDEELLSLHKKLSQGEILYFFRVRNYLLFFKDRLCLSSKSPLRSKLIYEFHWWPLRGHAGIKRTLALLTAKFYWPNMRKDVITVIEQFDTCHRIKYSTGPPLGLLQPFPILQNIWEDLTMDFIVGLPSSKGVIMILVFIDCLSKQAHYGSLPTSFTASQTGPVIHRDGYQAPQIPMTIISDCDPIFMSQF